MNKCLQSLLRENCNSSSHAPKSPIADFFQHNFQHTCLINVSSITVIYVFFHCSLLSYFSSKMHCVLLLIVIKKKK